MLINKQGNKTIKVAEKIEAAVGEVTVLNENDVARFIQRVVRASLGDHLYDPEYADPVMDRLRDLIALYDAALKAGSDEERKDLLGALRFNDPTNWRDAAEGRIEEAA